MGVATAIAIGGAVASIYAAKKNSDASKDASTSETQAADKALAVQERMYNEQRENNDPYLTAGRNALSRLGDLSSAPRPIFDPTQPGGSRTFRGAAGFQDATGQDRNMGATQGGARGISQQGFQPAMQLGQLGAGPGGPSSGAPMPTGQVGAPQGQPPMPPQGGGQMVMMQAPDGSPPHPVPAQFVAQFQAKGAKVVG